MASSSLRSDKEQLTTGEACPACRVIRNETVELKTKLEQLEKANAELREWLNIDSNQHPKNYPERLLIKIDNIFQGLRKYYYPSWLSILHPELLSSLILKIVWYFPNRNRVELQNAG